jgi:hypothetical protein
MKKKILAFFLAGILLVLCGCGAVSEAEEAIAALGDITPDSGEAVGQIQLMLEELSGKQRRKVENLQEFMEKKSTYERMCELLNEADRTIAAIGTVTPDSGEKIAEARDAYDALQADNLTGYVEDVYPILEQAEKTYSVMTELLTAAREAMKNLGNKVNLGSRSALTAAREAVDNAVDQQLGQYLEQEIKTLEAMEAEFRQLEATHLYEMAISSFSSGSYNKGNEYLTNLKSNYPDHEKSKVIEGEAVGLLLGVAETAVKNKEYKTADDILKFCNLNYSSSCSGNESYQKLRTNLDKTLGNLRPYNGKTLHNSIGGGWGKLKITAGPDRDALVRVQTVGDPEKYMLFYVRKGETAQVSVKDGSYYVKYCTGSVWYGDKEAFGVKLEDYKILKNGLFDFINFETTYSGNYVYYSVFSAEVD